MLKYYLYRHIRTDKSEPFYIGIGIKPSRYVTLRQEYKRAYEQSVTKRSEYWWNVFQQSNKLIEVEIMFESETLGEIEKKEQEIIQLYGRKDLNQGVLVNLTDGGKGRIKVIVKEKTKTKLSRTNKGRKHSEESRQKIIANHYSKNPNRVYNRTDEQKRRISQTLIEKNERNIYCVETKQWYSSIRKASLALFGTPEYCQAICKTLTPKAVNKSFRGFHFSETDNPINIYPSYFQAIRCINNGKEYISMAEAAEDLFGDRKYKHGISKQLSGVVKQYKGYTFTKI